MLNNVFLFGLDMFVSDDCLMRKKTTSPKSLKSNYFMYACYKMFSNSKFGSFFFSNQSKYFSNVKVVFSYDMYHDAFSGISDDIE